jgi:3-deoxy-D-manno-octulosonic-acid transferase
MELARSLYTLAGTAALPLLPVRLWWRGRREPGYRHAIGERFGRYATVARAPSPLWIHAVSVGETRAAAPLIERFSAVFPHAAILLTHMTATGRDTGLSLFGNRVTQAWLPYDLPFAVRDFLAHFRPAAGLLMETELWPNLIAHAHAQHVPLFLINARLSPRSASGYARVSALTRPMLGRLEGVAAQSTADASRLTALGAPPAVVTGNLKFDVAVPDVMRALGQSFRERFGASRRIWVAASTRDGEEALLLDALAAAPLPANALLVIVPRHPQRFEAVADLLRARNVAFVRRSAEAEVPPDVSVVLGDSMREMFAYYGAADVAFVGGSLLPFGAHTPIEPIAVGVPVLIGPHTFNFAEVTQGALAAGAALRVADAPGLIATVRELLDDASLRASMVEAGRGFVAAHRGASDRLWDWLAPQLPASLTSPDRG